MRENMELNVILTLPAKPVMSPRILNVLPQQ